MAGSKPKVYPADLVAAVALLYAEGLTQNQVAVRTGTTQKVITRLMRRHGLPVRRPGPPEARRCPECGSAFEATHKHRAQRYCGKPCQVAVMKRARPKENSPETRARIREKQAGRGEGKTYRKFHGRHEHRVVAERLLGRPLSPGEVVHHIDGDRLNNAPSNLEVITQGEHMRRHGLGIPGMRPAHEPWKRRRPKGSTDAVHI